MEIEFDIDVCVYAHKHTQIYTSCISYSILWEELDGRNTLVAIITMNIQKLISKSHPPLEAGHEKHEADPEKSYTIKWKGYII